MKNKCKLSVIRSICMLLVVITCFARSYVYALPPQPEETEGAAKLSITNPISRTEVGDSAYVKIDAAELPEDLFGYEFWVSYDEKLLTYKNIKPASGNDVTAEKSGDGRIKFAVVGTNGERLNTASATIEFTAKRSGRAEVILDAATILGADMKFSRYNTDKRAEFNIAARQTSGGGSGGGGGGGGSGLSTSGTVGIYGGTNSIGVTAPTLEPVVITSQPSDYTFTDMNEAEWASGAVDTLYSMGIISGYDDNSFRPNAAVTRAEFSKLICTAFNLLTPLGGENIEFIDVAPDEWYAPYIAAAEVSELINGYEDGTFRPEKGITREEAAVIICRCVDKFEVEKEPNRLNINFADESLISEYAAGYVDKLYTMSLINGDDNNMFHPLDSLSRAEAAQLICNLLVAEPDFSASPLPQDQVIDDSAESAVKAADFVFADEASTTVPEPTATPEPISDPTMLPEITPEPTAIIEPTPDSSMLPEATPEPTSAIEPSFTAEPDTVFGCESTDELYSYSNVSAYPIPDDGSRDAFYDDFTTFQRTGDGETAEAVFLIPRLTHAEVTGYFYSGEELNDFIFETSVDGANWNTAEYTADYLAAEGKWTRADYHIGSEPAKYLRVIFPETINWWTPLISEVTAVTDEPVPAKIVTAEETNTYVIPLYDSAEYQLNAYVVDTIGERMEGSVAFSAAGELPEGVTLTEDGLMTVSNNVKPGAVALELSCTEYGLETACEVMLRAAVVGDIDHDGRTDKTDLGAVIEWYAAEATAPDWLKYREGDINRDGIIDVIDIGYIAASAAELETE